MSSTTITVKATARGFDGVAVREIGDVFEVPATFKGTWFMPEVDGPDGVTEPAKPAKSGKKPAPPPQDTDLA